MAAGDIKTAYASTATITIGVENLASDTNLLAGRESTAVDNSTNKYIDALLSGKIRTGTTPTTARRIQVWVYAEIDDTPTYPDVLDGTDSDETITSDDIKVSALRLAAEMSTDATTGRDYYFGPISVAALFGGVLPQRWGVFVTHDTAVNLDVTAGDHFIKYTGKFETVEQ